MAHKKPSLLVLILFRVIYAHAANLPEPWVSLGCYTDATTSRTLNATFRSSSTNMTIEACISFCTPEGFTFAGLESGQECFCDNNIQATGVPATEDSCNMECISDSTEICGGTNRISIFKRIIPAGWESLGCFTDGNPDSDANRTLERLVAGDSAGMTIEECLAFCAAGGMAFAGVDLGFSCRCDKLIEPFGVPTTDGCNLTCIGDPNEICGGTNRINIYNHTALTAPVPPPPVPVIEQTVGTYKYQGCFVDSVNGTSRGLAHLKLIPGGTTLDVCISYCKVAGFPVAGLELGTLCYCDSYMALALRAPDSDCNFACRGPNISQACGALGRLAVYTDSTATPPALGTCLANIISLICHKESFRFNLQAVPVGGSTPSTLGVMTPKHDQGQPAVYPLITNPIFELPVNRSIDAVTFNFLNSTFFPDAVGTDGVSVAQNVSTGGEQTFIALSGQSFVASTQYCVMPNPLETFGPFIGPPTIAMNGQNDQWFLCSGPSLPSPTVFFAPVLTANMTCQNVWLSMIYPTVNSTCNGC